MSNLKVFRVDDGGEVVWAIADDLEKARAISREWLRDSQHAEGTPEYSEEYPDAEEITELPMDKVMTIDDDEGHGTKRTLTCAEWIADQGEGFLATTCF